MNEKDFMRGLFGMMFGMMEDDSKPTGGGTATPDEIRAAGELYCTKHDFAVGQLVTWKEGMDNCKYPKPGCPAVVVEKDDSLRSGMGTDGHLGGNHDYAPHGIRIGIIQGKGTFECYWVDANRFQPYE